MRFMHNHEKTFGGIILMLVNFSLTNAFNVISSPRVTDWGIWGQWEYCPQGTYATAFQLKIEAFQGAGERGVDDTALNAIRLFCNTPGEYSRNRYITSKVGIYGDWKSVFDCHTGIITAFQLKSENSQGKGDDTGASNLRVFCKGTNSDAAHKGIEGDGVYGRDWGEWTSQQRCFDRQAVCGIRTQVEDPLGRDGDDTSLNNVEMACCDVLNPAKSCAPSDKWEIVISCDNRQGYADMTCSFRKVRGVTTSSTTGSSKSEENNIMTQFGFSVQVQLPFLQGGFSSSLSKSKTTGYQWNTQSSESFTEEVTQTAEFIVPAGILSELYQVVGYCGSYTVYTTHFRKVDTPIESELV